MKKIYNSLSACVLLILIAPTALKAATINVSTIAALQTACNNSNSGDIIILANGTYQNVFLDIDNNNIIVKAQTPGGVYFSGYDDININGNYITFSGFQFTSGDIGSNYLIEVYGNHNLLTQLNISGYYAKKYIEIKAGTQYNEITYCNIEKKPADAIIGCTVQISTSATVPGYHKIKYCSFQNYYGIGGDNGNEPVRIGLGAEYLNKSRTIVEYCYFNNTGLGDSESISVKCKENVIRFCTFTNQQNAMLCFRNGDNNVAYSNFFINAGGIRVKEANNIYCYNNYFENSGVGSSADAVTYVYVAPLVPPTTASPRTLNLNNINFIHNTFYNCGDIDLGGTGATSNTWANNIFQKNSGSIYSNANNGTTWAGNIYQGSIGITIPSGMTSTNPFLTLNSEGYRGLSANSPVNNANASYPTILDIPVLDDDPTLLFDISGQARPATVTLKDAGCDEYTTGTTTNHPLTLSEVGPSYLVLSENTFDLSDTKITLFPNPTKNNFTLHFSKNLDSDLELTIFNTNGQMVNNQIISPLDLINSNKQLEVSNLLNGVYLVQLHSNNDYKFLKLVIQK
ncbi:chondroitinase-B domain-containing protein [Flavobacterium sp.]|jgi:hypothetical protein|uniref:chondroitinase-B domain-containing protein n=1 Tax=Flavobacterium sp. TaxID=239 RepID=UPI0037BFBEF4